MHYENRRANLGLPVLMSGSDRKFTGKEGSAAWAPEGADRPGPQGSLHRTEDCGSHSAASASNTEVGWWGVTSCVVVVVRFGVWILVPFPV